jgi:hypothetical protein
MFSALSPRRFLLVAVAASLFSASGLVELQARELYVSSSVGQDSNVGSLQSPFSTLLHAVSVLQDNDNLYAYPDTFPFSGLQADALIIPLSQSTWTRQSLQHPSL